MSVDEHRFNMREEIIDKLTRSIEEVASGRVLDTEVCRAARTDMESLETGWRFDWRGECNRGEVYKFLDTQAATRLVAIYFGEK